MRLPPIDNDTDRRVRKAVVERLAEEADAEMEYYRDNMPGLSNVSGREKLAFYRNQGVDYWIALYATFPKQALALMREYRRLALQYGTLVG